MRLAVTGNPQRLYVARLYEARSTRLVRGKLPTDHDHDGGALSARSANSRVINRRDKPNRPRPLAPELRRILRSGFESKLQVYLTGRSISQSRASTFCVGAGRSRSSQPIRLADCNVIALNAFTAAGCISCLRPRDAPFATHRFD